MEDAQLAAAAPGAVTTFYAYRGGAGCTLALAHIAVMLADRGEAGTPVLMVDWDLQAPGLHHYFPASPDAPGVLELFSACRDQLRRRGGAVPDDGGAALAQAVLAGVDWKRHVVRVDQRRPLFLMRAGRLDDSYAQRLAALDWEALFHACPALFSSFGAMLARHFSHVLVDAPHGRSDGAGICTALLPQRLVLLFDAGHGGGPDGLESLVQRVTTYRLSQEAEPRALMIYPVPTRMDGDDSARRARVRRGDPAAGQAGYQARFERVLGAAYGVPGLSLDSYFDEVLVPQSRAWAGGERLAVPGGGEAATRSEPDAPAAQPLRTAGDRCAPQRAYAALLAWLEPGQPPWCARRELALLDEVAQARAAQDGSAARHIVLAYCLLRLAQACREGGRDAHAIVALRESATLFAMAAGDGHLDTAAARMQLAALLLRRQQFDEARLLLRQAGEARTAVLGPHHADVLAVCALQAQALAGQGYMTAALARQQEVLDVQLRTLGAQHGATLDSQLQRAALLAQSGDQEGARQLLEQVLAARTRHSGAQHPATLQAADALAHVVARFDVPHPDNVVVLREARPAYGVPETGAGCAELL